MKTWTNPTIEELEVEQTAGGFFHFFFESGWTHGSHGNGNGGGTTGGENEGGEQQPGEEGGEFDETPEGMS